CAPHRAGPPASGSSPSHLHASGTHAPYNLLQDASNPPGACRTVMRRLLRGPFGQGWDPGVPHPTREELELFR
ncbi:MAG: hypothetical protein AVDCRST_MAG57-3869, partial [uncultured Blastococcus sp.]